MRAERAANVARPAQTGCTLHSGRSQPHARTRLSFWTLRDELTRDMWAIHGGFLWQPYRFSAPPEHRDANLFSQNKLRLLLPLGPSDSSKWGHVYGNEPVNAPWNRAKSSRSTSMSPSKSKVSQPRPSTPPEGPVMHVGMWAKSTRSTSPSHSQSPKQGAGGSIRKRRMSGRRSAQ